MPKSITREDALRYLQEHYAISQISEDMVTMRDIMRDNQCQRGTARRIVRKAIADGVLAPGVTVYDGENKQVVAYRILQLNKKRQR